VFLRLTLQTLEELENRPWPITCFPGNRLKLPCHFTRCNECSFQSNSAAPRKPSGTAHVYTVLFQLTQTRFNCRWTWGPAAVFNGTHQDAPQNMTIRQETSTDVLHSWSTARNTRNVNSLGRTLCKERWNQVCPTAVTVFCTYAN
jgi:hypothetical protein